MKSGLGIPVSPTMVYGASGNLLVNGGFEQRTYTNRPNWIQFGGDGTDPGIKSWASHTGTNEIAHRGWTGGGGLFQDVADSLITSLNANLSAATTSWTQVSMVFTLPANTVVRPVLACNGTPGTGGAFRFDDLELTSAAVPEPTTLGLAGLGIFGVLRLCRKAGKQSS